MPILYTFISLIAVSLISLVGVFTLSLKVERLKKVLLYLVSFAVGGLLGDAFLHLLPQTFENIGFNSTVSFLILFGIIASDCAYRKDCGGRRKKKIKTNMGGYM